MGSELAFWLQTGVLAANWQSAANWRLGCKRAANWRSGCKLAVNRERVEVDLRLIKADPRVITANLKKSQSNVRPRGNWELQLAFDKLIVGEAELKVNLA